MNSYKCSICKKNEGEPYHWYLNGMSYNGFKCEECHENAYEHPKTERTLTPAEELFRLIKWARKQGALLIKVNGVELTFPPDIDTRMAPSLPLPVRVNEDAKKAEEFIRTPSALDDPDYYIREQDSWASHTRPPPIG